MGGGNHIQILLRTQAHSAEVQPFRESRNANFQCLKARFTAVFPQRFPKGLQDCPSRGPVIPGQRSPRTAVISGVPRLHPLYQ